MNVNARGLTPNQVQEAIDNYYNAITNREFYFKGLKDELEALNRQRIELEKLLEGSK